MVVREATPLRRGCQRLGKFQKGTTFSAHVGEAIPFGDKKTAAS